MVAASMGARITSECRTGSHGFHTIFTRGGGMERTVANFHVIKETNVSLNVMDLTSMVACRRYIFFFVLLNPHITYIIKLKYLYYFLINKNLS